MTNKGRYIKILIVFLLISFLFSFTSLAAEDTIINMNFKEADIRDVLRTLAELAEVNLISDGSVQGEVTVHLKNMTFIDALNLICRTQGYEYLWDDKTVVVASPERIDALYADIVLKTVKVQYADPEELKGVVNGIYPELNIQLDKRNSKLVIKGENSTVNEGLELVKSLDVPIKVTTAAVRVRYNKLEDIQTYLQEIYPDLKIHLDNINKQLILSGREKEVKEASVLVGKLDVKPKEDVLKIVKVKYVPLDYLQKQVKGIHPELNVQIDSFNNQLILSGKKEAVEEARGLIEKLDIAPETKLVTVKVEHMDLASMENQLTSLYPELKVQQDEFNRQLILMGSIEQVQVARDLIGRLDLPKNEISKIVEVEADNLQQIKNNLTEKWPRISIEIKGESNQLVLEGKKDEIEAATVLIKNMEEEFRDITRVVGLDYIDVADIESILSDLYPDLNLKVNKPKKELILRGKEEKLMDALGLIEKLDRPKKQVVIESRVEEISRTDLQKIGISPEQMAQINFIKDEDGMINGLSLSLPDFLQFLENKGSANNLANPRLMTLNGEKARLLIGDQIPVEVQTVEDGQVTRTIEYIDAGITLEFEPWVTEDNYIILDIRPKVSSIGESIGTSLPPINTREAETKVRLKDGETLAIGGLIQDDLIESISRVPVLSEIPILGQIFKHRNVNNVKKEVIIFITPHVVKEDYQSEEKLESHQQEEEEEKLEKDITIGEELNQEKEEEKEGRVDDGSQQLKPGEDKELEGLSLAEINKILVENKKNREEEQKEDLPYFYNLYYTVSRDEKITDIAEKYGLEVEDILFVNGMTEEEVVAGVKLTIAIPRSNLYRIREGETLADIARKFQIALKLLKEINLDNLNGEVEKGDLVILPIAIR